MTTYRYPGIYTEEISVFPPQVEEVETALPAFIGYTAKATKKVADDLILVPTKINSMREFEVLFGLWYENEIEVAITTDSSDKIVLSDSMGPTLQYILYYSVKIYFDNGGGSCYILSVDTYRNPQQIVLTNNNASPPFGLMDGLNKLAEVADPSLVVIPEAVKLPETDYSSLVQATLLQCHTLGNRFAIFDLYHGDSANPDLKLNRSFFGYDYLNYGSAYYPFVKTTFNCYVNATGSNVKVNYSGDTVYLSDLKRDNSPLYRFVRKELKKRFVVLPSCGAVAGAYVTNDIKRGVWKSPANLNIAGINEPVVNINNHRQEELNVDPDTGKSINCIRVMTGKGTRIWGARTLAGNDNEWRYVPVSRFFIMVKESLRRLTCWTVFEPNDTNTWTKVRAMIETFLTLKWKDGALAGVAPQAAFYVYCGLGTTMTAQDILEGRIIIEVGLAILRPAEFIVLRFSHQLKNSG